MRGVVLILAAGEGSRLGDSTPKAFLSIGPTTLLRRAAEAAASASFVDSIVVAAPPSSVEAAERELRGIERSLVVPGGRDRQASAHAALRAAPEADAYLIHDAARALAPASLFDACLRELDECDAVVPALPVTDTVKRVDGQRVVSTVDRTQLVRVQTPQGFRADIYRSAHEQATRDGFIGTDDAALAENIGVTVRIIPGDDRNIKITTHHDLDIACALLGVQR